MMTPMAETLQEALKRLAATTVFREMLAENVCCGGCEVFFHRSLLWALNALPGTRYLATVEKKIAPLEGNREVDLLIFRNEPALLDQFWKRLSPLEYFRNCDGFAEIKVAETSKDKAERWGSWAAKEVAQDIDGKLGKIADFATTQPQAGSAKECLVLLLIAYFFGQSDTTAQEQIETTERAFWKPFREGRFCTGRPINPISALPLLDKEKIPSDPRYYVCAKAVLIAIGSVTSPPVATLRSPY